MTEVNEPNQDGRGAETVVFGIEELTREILKPHLALPEDQKVYLPYRNQDCLDAIVELEILEQDLGKTPPMSYMLEEDLEMRFVHIAVSAIQQMLGRSPEMREVAMIQKVVATAFVVGARVGATKGFAILASPPNETDDGVSEEV